MRLDKFNPFRRRMFVVAEATDNSITFSSALCRDVMKHNPSKAKVFTFTFKENGIPYYAFTIDPDIKEETQFSEIQYNSKYRCVGYECLIPSVTRIFNEYGINDNKKKLVVTSRYVCKMKIYIIRRP